MNLTPAEQRAQADGLPVLAAFPVDLLRALAGHPLIVTQLDGQEMLLRLATVDEALEANRRGREHVAGLLAGTGLDPLAGPAPMTEEQAAAATRPINVEAIVKQWLERAR